jgi:hypothetical protein
VHRSWAAICASAFVASTIGVALTHCGTDYDSSASSTGDDGGVGEGSVANGDGGGSGGDGGGAGPDGSMNVDAGPATCNGGACNVIPAGLLDPSSTTTWNPGILKDKTGAALGPDGLPVRTQSCATVPAQGGDATSAIQNALDGCKGKDQVVLLAAGTYNVSATIQVPSGVILRGMGSDVASGTVIASTPGGAVIAIGTLQDQVCYDSAFDQKPLLTADATKETTTVTVASTTGFAPGDLALIDQTKTSDIDEGDCTFFKRKPGYDVSERVEIASVSGTTLTLTTPLHFTFATAQAAQISHMQQAPVSWAGIEHIAVQGGRPGGYPGQHAGGVDVSNASYSWVKDVQVDGTTSGMGIRLGGTYRCVVRDSHVHNSYSYGFAQDNYGIVIGCGSGDNLVENNIARFMNKPIQLSNSGGGNVVGYNYMDNAWACDGNNDDGFQEATFDCHCAYPHMELMEGNWSPHMAAPTTHGAAGYLTFFRNYASSQWGPSKAGQATSAIVWSQAFVPQYSNVGAMQFDATDLKMTVIGNVLGSTGNMAMGLPADLGTTGTGPSAPATSGVYASTSTGPAIFVADQTSAAWQTIWLHGNYDSVNAKVMWNASASTQNLPMSTRALPASFYYAQRPGWWPAGSPWPWVTPDLATKVNTLPAQARSAAFDYYTTGDKSCTLDCGTYCCSVGASCTL